jgi:hypothetical protein
MCTSTYHIVIVWYGQGVTWTSAVFESLLSEFNVGYLMLTRAVYEELGKYGDVENQVLCRQRLEELDPSIRYCNYKMGLSNIQGSDLLDLSTQDGPGLDLLQSKLEAVMEEARLRQAVSMTELEWLGHKLLVRNEKTRMCILKGQQLERDLKESQLPAEKKLTTYDKMFVAYQDAKRHIREDLVRLQLWNFYELSFLLREDLLDAFNFQ